MWLFRGSSGKYLGAGTYIWGSDEFKKLYNAAMPFDKSPRLMTEIDRRKPLYFAFGSGHYICSNYSGECFTWGLNEYGQLGRHEGIAQQQPQSITTLSSYFISQVASGQSHSLCLTNEGLVFGWGFNRSGQLGIGSTAFRISVPTQIPFPSKMKVIAVCCGLRHSVALTVTRQVYSWGDNTHGQCGVANANESSNITTPTLITSIEHCRQIACGHFHTLFLLREPTIEAKATVFSVGKGSEGQLGHRDYTDRFEPLAIFSLVTQNVVQIACGAEHSVVRTELGDIYSFGSNSYGQLGVGENVEKTATPQKIPQLSFVWRIACGAHHTAALTQQGLWLWGKGSEGQLGSGEQHPRCFHPRLIELFDPQSIRRLYCGFDLSLVIVSSASKCRSKLFRELMRQEQDYMADLQATVTYFLEPIRERFLKESVVSSPHNVGMASQKSASPSTTSAASSTATPNLPTPQTSTSILREYLSHLFGNIEELLKLSQYLYFEMECLLHHSHTTSSKLMLGDFFLKMNLLESYYTYCNSRANSIAANILAKLKANSAFNNFLKECSVKLRNANYKTTFSDLETLLECPLERILQYHESFKLILECTYTDHTDFQATKTFYEELSKIKEYMEQRQEEANRTKDFWLQHPSLESIVTMERRYVADLSKYCISVGDLSMESFALLLFNDALVTCRLPIDNAALNPNAVLKVYDLSTTWIAEDVSISKSTPSTGSPSSLTKENTVFFRTPESKCSIIAIDATNKQHLLKIIQNTINRWVSPNKNKKIELLFKPIKHSSKQPDYSFRAFFETQIILQRSRTDSSTQQNHDSTKNVQDNSTMIGDSKMSVSKSQDEKIKEDLDTTCRRRYARYKFNSTHPNFPECIYEGEWLDAEMHGLGRMTFPNESIYEGDWQNNQPHGRGGLYNPIEKTFYFGSWINGYKEGKGKQIYYQSGDLYKGDWHKGKRNGFGTLSSEHFCYTGRWKDDKMEGLGVAIYENGHRYIGLFKDNQRSNIGTEIYPNGDYFQGEWENDKPTKRGYYCFATKCDSSFHTSTFIKGWFNMNDQTKYLGEFHILENTFVIRGHIQLNDPQKFFLHEATVTKSTISR
jgi:alpha-tubulin suppressor-like RCC1 family protein